jgi:hypothetical protein
MNAIYLRDIWTSRIRNTEKQYCPRTRYPRGPDVFKQRRKEAIKGRTAAEGLMQSQN